MKIYIYIANLLMSVRKYIQQAKINLPPIELPSPLPIAAGLC